MDEPNNGEESSQGLGTDQAVHSLCEEVEGLVAGFERRVSQNKLSRFLAHIGHTTSYYTVISYVCVTAVVVVLIIAAAMEDSERFVSGSRGWLVIEAFVLAGSVVFNTLLVVLRIKKELTKNIVMKRHVLDKILKSLEGDTWRSPRSFPDLHTPLSPCISLQWCIRDGALMNLPQPFLIRGDLIVMRPGHPAPGLCQALDGSTTLQTGEVFVPKDSHVPGEGPQPRVPLSVQKYILQETPIIKNLRFMLHEPITKPASFLENERYSVCNIWLERRLLPLVLVLSMAVNVFRFMYLDPQGGHWTEMLVVLQIHTILPLVPTLLPLLWTVVNTFGQAHILSCLELFKSQVDLRDSTESLGSCSDVSVEDAEVDIRWKPTLARFWGMFLGTQPVACPDFEMLHALGSVTALCCVDKKGLLSWPNPTAEKVLFFSSAPKPTVVEPDEDETEEKIIKEEKKTRKRRKTRSQSDSNRYSYLEVLDLTHETSKDAFGVMFDDPRWKSHLNALKPIGLDILLNTCNHQTSDWYTQFTDHVSCAARDNKDTVAEHNSIMNTVAVVNRRCLCVLSKEIGFTEEATNVFTHEATLGMYRQVPVEEAEREKQNRAKSFCLHQIPMPNQVSVVIRDKLTGMSQMLTQGTGDLVLDCCTDTWTGSDLQPLSELDRKRVLDFYHRTSMVSYCTAFAYKPMPVCVEEWPSHYTELVESPITTKMTHGEDMGVFLDHDEQEPPRKPRSHSVDSLLELSPASSLEDLAHGRILQSHQAFIGMVSLQYQAKQDFVQMIDKLESACIRFVHFSKENEVRSRVFAEKMGIEAGWNCHVSLMATDTVNSTHSSVRNLSNLGHSNAQVGSAGPEDSHPLGPRGSLAPLVMPRVHSAPSFMNTDEVQVKFAATPLPILYDDDHDTSLDEEDNIFLLNVGMTDNQGPTHPSSAKTNTDTSSPLKTNTSNNSTPKKSVGETNTNTNGNINSETRQLLGRDSDSNDDDDDDDDEEEDDEDDDPDIQSDSRYTSSYVTEKSEESIGPLDNRAHLPRGIENIRPHLENIDNVPLLVNLFTDCTPSATCEMVEIMQDEGEVVLVVGSSLSMDNTPVFMQAHCSLGIEPLFPACCARRPSPCVPWSELDPSVTQLASDLLALPCAMSFQRDDNFKLVQLIMESRHYIFAMRNCFYLMLCCLLAVVLCQLVCGVLLLPPLMAVQHVVWLVLVVVPCLSLSLMGNPNEARTMSMATHKNTSHVNKQMVEEFFVQFCTRFFPSIVVAVFCFALILHSFCVATEPPRCHLYDFSYDVNNTTVAFKWTDKFQGGLVIAQNIFVLYFVLFLVAISMSLVHWQDHLWQRCPFYNYLWSFTAVALLVVQVIFSTVDSFARRDWFGDSMGLSEVHPAVWVVGAVWPLVTISLNEIAKRREIKLAVRRQRRARLDFDTKLGMNSPF